MNIFLYELKSYAKSLWMWGLNIASLQIIFMMFFPGISRDAEVFDQILELYPQELLDAFGMGEITSMATVFGYYAVVFVFVQLCLAIQSAYYGFNFLSVEEREKTADFLFTRPVSRNRILIAKYLAALAALFITFFVVVVSTFIAVEGFRAGKAYDVGVLILLLAVTPLFQLIFFSAGMMITTFVSKVRSVIGYAMSLSFGLYVMNAMRAIIGGEGLLLMISPFYHFRPAYILMEGELPFWGMIGSFAVVLIFTAVGTVLYNRRNIQAL